MASSRDNARVERLIRQLSSGGPTSWADALAADVGPTLGSYKLELAYDYADDIAEWSAPLEAGDGTTVGTVAVAFRLNSAGAVKVDHVTLTPRDGRIPDAVFMKTARYGALYRQISRDFTRTTSLWTLPSSWLPALVEGSVLLPRPGRPKTPRFYAEWAKRYVDAQKADAGRPIQQLLKEYPEENENTIRAFVRRARERKLLTDAGSGKAGGHLTPKAKRILKEGN